MKTELFWYLPQVPVRLSSLHLTTAVSAKSVPVSGTVCAINRHLDDDPGIVTRSPEKHGWLYRLDNIDDTELGDLMEEDDYLKYLETLD